MGKEEKIFVLDTSVILYAHDAILNFAEHDIGIPITVLEELDQFKKGNDTRNFEAREFIRMIDKLSAEHTLQDWIPLNGKGKGKFRVVMNAKTEIDAEKIFDEKKPDHKILNAALTLQSSYPERKVILVTKDINLRIKADALGLQHVPRVVHGDQVVRAVDSFQRSKSASHFAAQMKSFSDRPPIACVEYSTRHLL